MNKFPKTLAAFKVAILEESPGCCASDSANWAIGDALIEECGSDPVWDVDWQKSEFKGGLKIREAFDYLEEHLGDALWCGVWELLTYYREVAETYPPSTRKMNITYQAHRTADGPEDVARASKELPPGETLCLTSEDAEAHDKYGPC
jgi:hypothetical protein